MEEAVQCMAGISFLVLGISTLVRTQDWTALMQAMAEATARAGLIVGCVALAFGAFVIAFHPVWNGVPVILTVIGWMALVEGVIYLLFPAFMPLAMGWWLKHPAIAIRMSGFILIAVSMFLLGEKTLQGWWGS